MMQPTIGRIVHCKLGVFDIVPYAAIVTAVHPSNGTVGDVTATVLMPDGIRVGVRLNYGDVDNAKAAQPFQWWWPPKQ